MKDTNSRKAHCVGVADNICALLASVSVVRCPVSTIAKHDRTPGCVCRLCSHEPTSLVSIVCWFSSSKCPLFVSFRTYIFHDRVHLELQVKERASDCVTHFMVVTRIACATSQGSSTWCPASITFNSRLVNTFFEVRATSNFQCPWFRRHRVLLQRVVELDFQPVGSSTRAGLTEEPTIMDAADDKGSHFSCSDGLSAATIVRCRELL